MHPHKQIKQMDAEYNLGPFAAADQGPYLVSSREVQQKHNSENKEHELL